MNKTLKPLFALILTASFSIAGVKAQPGEPPQAMIDKMKTEEFTYTTDGVTQKGYVAYIPQPGKKIPIVLVVPEWWGYNEYVKMRARKLAELGYLAMVVDIYGDGKVATTPDEAQKLSGQFYGDPQLGKARLESAERKAKTYPQADPRRVAAIGYCFGGAMVLNGAKQSLDFRAVVSFHGGLKGIPARKGAMKTKILICHGGADKFSSEEDVKAFKENLDSAGAKYLFKVYPGALHAFTNPDATALGKKFNLPIAYNEAADKASWEDMRRFLRDAFYMK